MTNNTPEANNTPDGYTNYEDFRDGNDNSITPRERAKRDLSTARLCRRFGIATRISAIGFSVKVGTEVINKTVDLHTFGSAAFVVASVAATFGLYRAANNAENWVLEMIPDELPQSDQQIIELPSDAATQQLPDLILPPPTDFVDPS